jgi:uncharacterized protein YaaQ
MRDAAARVAGVEDEEMETVVQTARERCTARRRQSLARPIEVGGATIFVVNMERFGRA